MLNRRSIFVIAAAACVDPRTAIKFFEGKKITAMARSRLERLVAEHPELVTDEPLIVDLKIGPPKARKRTAKAPVSPPSGPEAA
jgi:hypothetical protein